MTRESRYRTYPPDTVEEFRKIMEPRAGRPLTERECLDSINNLLGFINILRDWRDAEERDRRRDQPAVVNEEKKGPAGQPTKSGT